MINLTRKNTGHRLTQEGLDLKVPLFFFYQQAARVAHSFHTLMMRLPVLTKYVQTQGKKDFPSSK
jgi:hypothetical protein